MEEITTDRIAMEPLRVEHAEKMFTGLRNAQLYTFIPDKRPPSIQELERRYRSLERHSSIDGREIWLNWALRLRETASYIGYVQATLAPDGRATIGYVLFKDAWGKGYATEALRGMLASIEKKFGTRRFYAYVHRENRSSLRVLERLGFIPAGAVSDVSTDEQEDVAFIYESSPPPNIRQS